MVPAYDARVRQEGWVPQGVQRRWKAIRISGTYGHPLVHDGHVAIVDPAVRPTKDCLVVRNTPEGHEFRRYGGRTQDGRTILMGIDNDFDMTDVCATPTPGQLWVIVGVIHDQNGLSAPL